MAEKFQNKRSFSFCMLFFYSTCINRRSSISAICEIKALESPGLSDCLSNITDWINVGGGEEACWPLNSHDGGVL